MINHLPPLAPALITDAEQATPRALTEAAINAAQGILTDPTDAAAYLNLDDHLLHDGTIDHRGLQAAATDLARRKPYLAAGRTVFGQ